MQTFLTHEVFHNVSDLILFLISHIIYIYIYIYIYILYIYIYIYIYIYSMVCLNTGF